MEPVEVVPEDQPSDEDVEAAVEEFETDSDDIETEGVDE